LQLPVKSKRSTIAECEDGVRSNTEKVPRVWFIAFTRTFTKAYLWRNDFLAKATMSKLFPSGVICGGCT